MGKSTEGVVLKDGLIEETLSNALAQLDISSAVNGHEIEARKHFVQNLKKAIGDLTNRQMPIGIKPTLQRLIQESDYYIEHGNENAFIRLCQDAVEVTRQGWWSFLSYWISTPQNMCYAIHWSLKDAMDIHKKEMLKVKTQQNHASKNDPVSTCSIDPNATRNQPEHSATKESFAWSKPGLLKQILTQYGLERSKTDQSNVVRVSADPFASCQELYKNKI